MTPDLTALSLMAYKNSLKFMTRTHMQVSTNTTANPQPVCFINQQEDHYTQKLDQFVLHRVFNDLCVIKPDSNISCQSYCLSLEEGREISQL